MIISIVFAVFILIGTVLGFLFKGREYLVRKQLESAFMGLVIGTGAATVGTFLFYEAPFVLYAIVIAGIIIAIIIRTRKVADKKADDRNAEA
jgi:hypothetical protein